MNYTRGDVVLFPYPFTDLSLRKVRPAVIVGIHQDMFEDVFIVPITSKIKELGSGEFILSDWKYTGLNVISAVKRGCYLVDTGLILRRIGSLSNKDMNKINESLRIWLELV